MNNNALATHGDSWEVMLSQAQTLVKSKFLPVAIDSPEKAIAVMMTGQELGIPKMQALRQIVIINGKPTLSAELMLALIYRDHGDNAIRFIETTATACTIEYRRKSWEKAERFNFTIEDARRAQLAGGQTWQKYPQALLRARCISAVGRLGFPDSIGGMYTAEELGANVSIDVESGAVEIIDVTPAPASQKALQAPQGDIVEGTAIEVRQPLQPRDVPMFSPSQIEREFEHPKTSPTATATAPQNGHTTTTVAAVPSATTTNLPAGPGQIEKLADLARAKGYIKDNRPTQGWRDLLAEYGVQQSAMLNFEQADHLIERLQAA